jgi:hypothetical protein
MVHVVVALRMEDLELGLKARNYDYRTIVQIWEWGWRHLQAKGTSMIQEDIRQPHLKGNVMFQDKP